MTSNCLIEPRADVSQPHLHRRVPSAGRACGISGDGDFSTVVQAARALPGFAATEAEETITVGFGRDAVLGVAGKVIEAVKSGALKHFFLIGGCDGAAPGRNYYTEFAEAVPANSMILTLGCGKYRFNSA